MIECKDIKDFFRPYTYFTTTKLLTLKDYKVGLINRGIQLMIFGWVVLDLMYNELYLKTEIPSGYTTFWAENGNLTNIQQNTNFDDYVFCDNSSYNYAYDTQNWIYTNISCVNLPYSEMYQKGENEFFFTTHFTENLVECTKEFDDNTCERVFYKDYFTIGSEGMNLGFDHFYTTSFEEGSNLGNVLKLGIDTYIKDENGGELAHFRAGQTIMMNVSEWLRLTGVSLEDLNSGTNPSLEHPYVPERTRALFRLSGLEIIINVNFHNMMSIAGYTTTTSEINLQANEGWSSKGSLVTYMNYPNISMVNNSYSYVDRYRYGIKFKFVISGIMGNFNMNNLVNHITSGIVLLGLSGTILSTIIILSKTKYGKYYKKIRYTQKSISNPSKTTLFNLQDTSRNQNLRNRKHKIHTSVSKWHDEVCLDSESSFDYSQNLSDDYSQNLSEEQNKEINEINLDNSIPINFYSETHI